MAFMLERAAKFLSTLQNTINKSLNFPFPPEFLAPALVGLPESYNQKPSISKSITDILKDAILWAVPKRRRSREKRRTRRFGHHLYFSHLIKPKTHILICPTCKHYHEAKQLCPNCYEKVKTETTLMQETIIKSLGIAPVENEVVVLYTDDDRDPNLYKGKRIVEMNKPRPKIFCDNLLERTTQGEAKTKEVMVKPNVDIS